MGLTFVGSQFAVASKTKVAFVILVVFLAISYYLLKKEEEEHDTRQ
ncbi:MAG: hypothetical protein O8C58_00985 [Candidatus Methanoperedens sp.]|nr:hypothetical protein [Candidatus Methanoperedens sp.]